MKNSIIFSLGVILALCILAGCSASSTAVTPEIDPGNTDQAQTTGFNNRIPLGMYCAVIDTETLEWEILPLRTADITLNINGFMNADFMNFTISDFDLDDFATEGLLSCNLNLTHPLAGYPEYNIFDVWLVFLHNGTSLLNYNNMTYSGGPDQAENEAMVLNPDGYTRWYNELEFSPGQWLLVTYNPGLLSNLPEPSAMVNPFKIFADGLYAQDDFYDWITLSSNANNRGIFRSGYTNSRRFDFKFPIVGDNPLIEFQYLVLCSWEPGDPTLTGNPLDYEPWDFPSNANVDEPFFILADADDSTMFSTPTGTSGGYFAAEIEIFDWQGGIVDGNGVINEVERLLIEGDFVDGDIYPFEQIDLHDIASDGSENSSVVEVEINAVTPGQAGDHEYWIIIESAGENGESYNQGVSAPYPDGRRAAFYRGTVRVLPEDPGNPPEIYALFDDTGFPPYKNPVYPTDISVTYSVEFEDLDSITHTIYWAIRESSVPSMGTPDYVGDTFPVDWSDPQYITDTDYNIWVMVEDEFGNDDTEPFEISLFSEPNVPPEIDHIYDDIEGPDTYKNPVDQNDPPVTYSVDFTDPDGPGETITWWIVEDGETPTPADIVTMPVDWTTYDYGSYEIHVEVDDEIDTDTDWVPVVFEESTIPIWDDEEEIQTGNYRLPAMDDMLSGTVVLAVGSSDGTLRYMTYDPSGDTWSGPFLLANDPGDNMIISVDADTTSETIYCTSDNTPYWRYTGGTGIWDSAECPPAFSHRNVVAIDYQGRPNLVTVFIAGMTVDHMRAPYWGCDMPNEWEFSPFIPDGHNACFITQGNITTFDSSGTLFFTFVYDRTLSTWNYSSNGPRQIRVCDVPAGGFTSDYSLVEQTTGATAFLGSPAIACDPSDVLHVAYTKYDVSESEWQIRHQESSDGAESWTPGNNVYGGSTEPGLGYVFLLSDSNGSLYSLYMLGDSIEFKYSTDGDTWSDSQTVNESSSSLPPGTYDITPRAFITSDDILHVVWIRDDSYSGFGDIWHRSCDL